jgi:hypothetical protein
MLARIARTAGCARQARRPAGSAAGSAQGPAHEDEGGRSRRGRVRPRPARPQVKGRFRTARTGFSPLLATLHFARHPRPYPPSALFFLQERGASAPSAPSDIGLKGRFPEGTPRVRLRPPRPPRPISASKAGFPTVPRASACVRPVRSAGFRPVSAGWGSARFPVRQRADRAGIGFRRGLPRLARRRARGGPQPARPGERGPIGATARTSSPSTGRGSARHRAGSPGIARAATGSPVDQFPDTPTLPTRRACPRRVRPRRGKDPRARPGGALPVRATCAPSGQGGGKGAAGGQARP